MPHHTYRWTVATSYLNIRDLDTDITINLLHLTNNIHIMAFHEANLLYFTVHEKLFVALSNSDKREKSDLFGVG